MQLDCKAPFPLPLRRRFVDFSFSWFFALCIYSQSRIFRQLIASWIIKDACDISIFHISISSISTKFDSVWYKCLLFFFVYRNSFSIYIRDRNSASQTQIESIDVLFWRMQHILDCLEFFSSSLFHMYAISISNHTHLLLYRATFLHSFFFCFARHTFLSVIVCLFLSIFHIHTFFAIIHYYYYFVSSLADFTCLLCFFYSYLSKWIQRTTTTCKSVTIVFDKKHRNKMCDE